MATYLLVLKAIHDRLLKVAGVEDVVMVQRKPDINALRSEPYLKEPLENYNLEGIIQLVYDDLLQGEIHYKIRVLQSIQGKSYLMLYFGNHLMTALLRMEEITSFDKAWLSIEALLFREEEPLYVEGCMN